MIEFDYDKAKNQLYNLFPEVLVDKCNSNGRILLSRRYYILNGILPILAAKYNYDGVSRIVSTLENIMDTNYSLMISNVLYNLIETCGIYTASNGNKYLYPCLVMIPLYSRETISEFVIERKYIEEAIDKEYDSYLLFNYAENGIKSYLNNIKNIDYLLKILSYMQSNMIADKDILTNFAKLFQKTLYKIDDNGSLIDEILNLLGKSDITNLFSYTKYEGLFYHYKASLLMLNKYICKLQGLTYEWVIKNYDKIYNKDIIYSYLEEEGYDIKQFRILEQM